jgi:hypothetical protein
MHGSFEIIIVHGVNRELEVTPSESILDVKLRAMDLFSIPRTKEAEFVLRIKRDEGEVQLAENETVAQARLHQQQKVTLAAGVPYGC